MAPSLGTGGEAPGKEPRAGAEPSDQTRKTACRNQDQVCIVFFFNFYFILFVYIWLHWVFDAAHALFSSCGEWGLLFVAVHGLLIAVASLVAEHKAAVVVARRLSSCGSWALEHRLSSCGAQA